ncbi:MAG: protoporphyrinogen oxidase HemJ [Rhodospirillales bacterium]
MLEVSASAYLWIKALHIISVMAWMAGMLYLPRLFVYHAEAESGSAQSETFKIMERRLLRGIVNPAMIASFVFGGLLLAILNDWSAGWLYVKLVGVLGLAALHGMVSKWRREFAEDRNRRPARFYRLINEVPAVLMVVIVIMVVLKPF